jgi:ubiquinol-cytochrome c reductase cytochrome b subunit
LSIPVVGTWLSFLIFGGPFPGHLIIGRLYIAHVLLLPGIIVVLAATHLVIAARHKPAQFPGRGRSENTISGQRLLPTRLTKSGGLFLLVFGVLAALGGWAQINPVWLYGPYDPAQVSAGSGPDWYLAFVDGASRLFPSWEIRVWGHDVPPVFWATVVLPGVLIVLAAAYPFIEARLTNDRARHHLLQRPRDVPVRTSLGAMALSLGAVLFVSAGNDTIARAFDVSLNAMIWAGRIALLTVPPVVYLVTYRLCLGLQRHDRQVLEHGIETGIITMLPSGAFMEVHQPLGPVDERGHGQLSYAGTPVPKRINQLRATATRVRGFFYPVTEKPHLQTAIDEHESTLHAEGAHAPLGSAQADDRAGPDRDVRI